VGHCYEEGSFRRDQPFVEAFGTYLQESDLDALTADLGPDGPEPARLVPSGERAYSFLAASARRPERGSLAHSGCTYPPAALCRCTTALLLVLEDLHDADRSTLDVLLHVSRDLHRAPLLVVGTYRDVEADRAHPLSADLTGLHRSSELLAEPASRQFHSPSATAGTANRRQPAFRPSGTMEYGEVGSSARSERQSRISRDDYQPNRPALDLKLPITIVWRPANAWA
jgi:hypothetical protein